MVAFANTTGGNLLVGVDDNGEIAGLRNPEEHDYALTKAVEDLCVPAINYKKEVVPLTHKKSVLCYSVKAARKKPHYAKDNEKNRYGRAYVRVEDKTIKASREMTQILRRTNTKKNFSFKYGDKEALLMKLLDQQDEITLGEFQAAANIPRRVASSTLVLLVLAGVLKIIPQEKEDIFKLKNI